MTGQHIDKPNEERGDLAEVFGFRVPTRGYYLHRGHAWAKVEGEGQVRVGLDDFSQKILGPADVLKLPEPGKIYYQNHICLAVIRQGHKAPFLAPVDGTVAAINPKVQERPALVHDDPYDEGWLFTVVPTNLERNLEQLLTGEAGVAYIEEEAHRLLHLMETKVGVTLPSGGAFVDDVYGHYPALGWRPLVQDLFLPVLTRTWRKRKVISASPEELGETEALRREVLKVLSRTAEDRTFRRALMNLEVDALEGYRLSPEAKAAILSGDLTWINEHIGDLTQKQLMFVLSCLLPGNAGERARRRAVS